MSTLSLSGSYSGSHEPHHFGLTSVLSAIRGKWHEYRLLRSMDAIPYDVMKDVGFPAAERTDEM
jgi:hypothetical protein